MNKALRKLFLPPYATETHAKRKHRSHSDPPRDSLANPEYWSPLSAFAGCCVGFFFLGVSAFSPFKGASGFDFFRLRATGPEVLGISAGTSHSKIILSPRVAVSFVLHVMFKLSMAVCDVDGGRSKHDQMHRLALHLSSPQTKESADPSDC